MLVILAESSAEYFPVRYSQAHDDDGNPRENGDENEKQIDEVTREPSLTI